MLCREEWCDRQQEVHSYSSYIASSKLALSIIMSWQEKSGALNFLLVTHTVCGVLECNMLG
jgi:hypothetical protein